MNPINLSERFARLKPLSPEGYPDSLADAKEYLDLMRIIMSQFAARRLMPDCHCCTCNARRLVEHLGVPHAGT